MTKAELIEALMDYDDNDVVHFSYPAGDYWHSTIVKPVEGVEIEKVIYSEYFETLVVDNDDDKELNENNCAIVLR